MKKSILVFGSALLLLIAGTVYATNKDCGCGSNCGCTECHCGK